MGFLGYNGPPMSPVRTVAAPTPAHSGARPVTALAAVCAGILCLPTLGCSSAVRRLDPVFAGETYRPVLKFHYEPGITDPGILKEIEAGDIIAFSSTDPKSGSITVLMAALSQVSHLAIVVPQGKKLTALSADSDRGVYIDSIQNCVQSRNFFVFSFPKGLLDMSRLNQFAARATFLGALDYDWTAVFGWNSNLTPNTLTEVGGEHTCATVVAAALHFSGLSPDRAWWGIVTPGDIIHSLARRNLNGPAVEEVPRKQTNRTVPSDVWGSLQ
jgi:hypothetical protein